MIADQNLIQELDEKIIKKIHPPYLLQAFLFVFYTLDTLMQKIISETDTKRHVTGQELSFALRDCALKEFGPCAKMVLEHWGIHNTQDVGNIVYQLIQAKLMSKTETDRLEDFCNVYDFEEEFVRKFRFSIDSVKPDPKALHNA